MRAAPAQRRAEGPRQGDAEEGGPDIGPVVDVLVERPGFRAPAASYQRHRIDLQQEGEGAALLIRLGIEEVSRAEAQACLLRPVGVLVQQEAEIGRWPVGGAQGQQHARGSGACDPDPGSGAMTGSRMRPGRRNGRYSPRQRCPLSRTGKADAQASSA